MSQNIPGNIVKHSGECSQTFRGMLLNNPGNVTKHSGECSQTFRGILLNNPWNVLKHSGECSQTFWGMSYLLWWWRIGLSFIHNGCLLFSIVDCMLCHLLCQKFSKVTCCQTQQPREFNLYALKKFLFIYSLFNVDYITIKNKYSTKIH